MPSHGRVNDFEIFPVARTSRHGNSGTLMLSGCVRGSCDALWPLRIRPRPHVMHEDDATKDCTSLTSELKPRAYKPPAETRRVFAWTSSGRSERTPSQFFSN